MRCLDRQSAQATHNRASWRLRAGVYGRSLVDRSGRSVDYRRLGSRPTKAAATLGSIRGRVLSLRCHIFEGQVYVHGHGIGLRDLSIAPVAAMMCKAAT